MNEQDESTCNRLLDKSQEAFLLAIELYNRPTIRYHAEGCCFFLCNAWELMLKAHIIKRDGGQAVYYPDSDRTLSLGGENPSWCYSQQAVDLMVHEVRRDPKHVIDSMRAELAKRGKPE